MLWRRSRALLLAADGELDRAEALAREAVELGARRELENDHADALVDLAGILARRGRRAEALAELEEARARYERKGNLPSLERAQRLARDLATTPTAG
jgi:tetratricopeptide (TPR) repeat protein